MRYLTTTLIILGSLFCYGQNEGPTEKDRIVNSIIGNWIFSGGYEKGNKNVEVGSYPLLDSITFNSDMTFKYACRDSQHGNLSVTGTWDIDSKGTTIKFMNRVAHPDIGGKAIDFQRKFKLIGLAKLRIEEEFEIVSHPDPNQQVGKVGREIMILNYIRTK